MAVLRNVSVSLNEDTAITSSFTEPTPLEAETFQRVWFNETSVTSNVDVTSIHVFNVTRANYLTPDGCVIVQAYLSLSVFRRQAGSVISPETGEMINNLKAGIIIPILFLVGAPSNCISMVVFVKHGLKQRINLCLFCLSVIDLLYITFNFTVNGEHFVSFSSTTGVVLAFVIKHHILGLFGLGWASQFVSAIIACERCLCVVWPLRSGTLLKTTTTAVIILVGAVVITGGRFVVTEKYSTICVFDINTEITHWVLSLSEYYEQNRFIVDVFDGILYGLILPATNCTIVVMTTTATAIMLQKSVTWRKQSSSSSLSDKEVALTKMLIYVSAQFVILATPNLFFRFICMFYQQLSPGGRYAGLYFALLNLTEVCASMNSSLNFFVYYFTGTKFRETVNGLFRGRRTRKRHTEEGNVEATEISTFKHD